VDRQKVGTFPKAQWSAIPPGKAETCTVMLFLSKIGGGSRRIRVQGRKQEKNERMIGGQRKKIMEGLAIRGEIWVQLRGRRRKKTSLTKLAIKEKLIEIWKQVPLS